jgi:hypothetical protein
MSEFFAISFFAVLAAAWITHIVVCIKMAAVTGSAIALLLVGFFVFPVGIIHGICIWFGFSWM